MSKRNIYIVIVIFIISLLIIVIGSNTFSLPAKIFGINNFEKTPKQLYRVYLSGESLGVIESKKELDDFINLKQENLKQKYNVDKIYAPSDLKITEELTYNEKILTPEEIYKKIQEIKGESAFTIEGYRIDIEGIEKKFEDDSTIKEAEDKTIYVIDKEIFQKAVDKTITAFIDSEKYEAYLNDTQKELEENEIGSLIENLYIQNKIKITKELIPAGGEIFTNQEELNKYLLFGTTEEQETYTVKAGDTIETIADDNRLSVNEFLVANSNFKSANDLLFPGQQVKIGLISPQFDIVELEYLVYETAIKKDVEYKNDSSQYVGYEKVEEEGQDGLALVTERREIVNGEITNTLQNPKTLVPAINKVIVRGTKKKEVAYIGDDIEVPVEIGSWVWPTNTPYYISSGYGWRWGSLHRGIDIAGPGYMSPIKAANNGIVTVSSYTEINGNFIVIKHSNGLNTYYGHMAKRYKQVGDVVMANDTIGGMGATGFATGVHLHFGVFNGNYMRGAPSLNPYTIFK